MMRKIRFLTVKGVFMAIALLLAMAIYLPGCSSDTGEGSEPETVTDTISVVNGGVHKVGQAEVTFPAGAVDSDVTVTGQPVNLPEYPNNLTLVSGVHKISLSKPDAYNEYTASISIKVDDNTDNVYIYHSSDGANWTNIGRNVDGNTISALIPAFSYFMAATPVEQSSGIYSLNITNQSASSINVCLYQKSGWNPDAMSLAWYTASLLPDCNATFNWSNDYSFCWGQTGAIRPGVMFQCAQVVEADLNNANKIGLNRANDGNYYFTSPTSGSQSGSLSILTGASVPTNKIAAGYACSGRPVLVQQAFPGGTVEFSPEQTEIWLGISNCQQGEIIDVGNITNPIQIPSSTSGNINATYTPDNQWDISSQPPWGE